MGNLTDVKLLHVSSEMQQRKVGQIRAWPLPMPIPPAHTWSQRSPTANNVPRAILEFSCQAIYREFPSCAYTNGLTHLKKKQQTNNRATSQLLQKYDVKNKSGLWVFPSATQSH